MSNVIVIIILVILLVVIPVSIYLISKAKVASRLSSLQNKINDLINGASPINNLKVVNSLNIINSNPNDMFPLKLITTANKNVITFKRYGVIHNEFGVMSNPASTESQKNYNISSLLPTVTQDVVSSVDSLQQQINDIVSGKTHLNNLKVNGNLTVFGGGTLKAVEGVVNKLALIGGLSLVNKDANNNKLNSCILFGKDGMSKGYYGLSATYKDSNNKSVYDLYSSNVNYKNTSWDSRPTLPACVVPTDVMKSAPAKNDTDIALLEEQLNNILNGTTPITNLVVNGDVTVNSESESPLSLDVQSCATTSIVGFNNLDARGVNGYGGPFDWVGSSFDLTGTITSSGKLLK